MSRTTSAQTHRDVHAGDLPQSAPVNPAAPSALDSRTFAIGVLSVTACVLFVGLVLLAAAPPQPAHAAAQNDRAGDYIMVTQQVSDSTEVVGVIDAAARQMVYYVFDPNRETIEFVARVPLDQMPSPQPREPEPRPRRR